MENNNFDEHLVLRCDKCSEIPQLLFSKIFDNIYIYYHCKNEHKLYDDYKIIINLLNQQNFDNIKCVTCSNKSKFYIIKEKIFICEKCIKNKKNEYINIEKFDNYCSNHIKKDLICYCFDCKKDFCNECLNLNKEKEKDNHLFFDYDNKNKNNSFINNYKNKINEFNENIDKLKKEYLKIKENIEKSFYNYIKLIEKEKKIYQYLIDLYEFKQNNLKFNIFSNIVSNLEKNFSYKNIYIENEPIESLKNLYEFFDKNHLIKYKQFCNFENNNFENHKIIQIKNENKIIYGNENNNESIIFEKEKFKLKIRDKIFNI